MLFFFGKKSKVHLFNSYPVSESNPVIKLRYTVEITVSPNWELVTGFQRKILYCRLLVFQCGIKPDLGMTCKRNIQHEGKITYDLSSITYYLDHLWSRVKNSVSKITTSCHNLCWSVDWSSKSFQAYSFRCPFLENRHRNFGFLFDGVELMGSGTESQQTPMIIK